MSIHGYIYLSFKITKRKIKGIHMEFQTATENS